MESPHTIYKVGTRYSLLPKNRFYQSNFYLSKNSLQHFYDYRTLGLSNPFAFHLNCFVTCNKDNLYIALSVASYLWNSLHTHACTSKHIKIMIIYNN